MKSLFRKYLMPGLVLQSIVIGGGYGTGRELVEFFLNEGPVGGLLAMLTATVVWSAVIAISFELARSARSYDYRTFVHNLLGPAWIAYEVVYVAGVVLVISVVGAASGELLQQMFGLSYLSGILLIVSVVGIIVYFGSSLIERLLTVWSLLIYAAYLTLIVVCLARFGDVILKNLVLVKDGAHWFQSGIKYAAYNIGMVPAMLFCIRHLETRREALWAGVLAGPLAMLPALFIYMSLLSQYPQILSASIPTNVILAPLGLPVFHWIFQIILLGTILDTGVGFIHGFNERVARTLEEHNRKLTPWLRGVIGIVILLIAVFVANAVGLIDLIARGYGGLTWVYLAVFVIPVLTLGAWRIIRPTAPARSVATNE